MSGEVLRILDVGNCDPDHTSIRRFLEPLHAQVDRVMFVDEALARVRESRYHLVLVNRLIFADGSDGLPLIEKMKADPALRHLPVMMISNFPDAQDRAVAAGAIRGIGKAALADARALDIIREALVQSPHDPRRPASR